MKRHISLFVAFLLSATILTPVAFAYSTEYSNGPTNTGYDRYSARNYLNTYTYLPNPNYYDYTYSGGDCTNFISQMLYAGGMSMTARSTSPTTAHWYYYGPSIPDRTPTWTGAHFFRQYWGVVNGIGQRKANAMYKYSQNELANTSGNSYANLVSRCELGDVLQFVRSNGTTSHSMAVQRVYIENGVRKVTVSQHTANEYYHLTERVSRIPANGWLCLLKMKPPASGSSSFTIEDLMSFASKEQIASLLAKEVSALDVSLSIDALSSAELESLYNGLTEIPTKMGETRDRQHAMINRIGDICDARFAADPNAVQPLELLTRDVLLKNIDEIGYSCRSMLWASDLVGTPSVQTAAEDARLSASLAALPAFRAEAEANAVTPDQVFSYWCKSWAELLDQAPPATYYDQDSGNYYYTYVFHGKPIPDGYVRVA